MQSASIARRGRYIHGKGLISVALACGDMDNRLFGVENLRTLWTGCAQSIDVATLRQHPAHNLTHMNRYGSPHLINRRLTTSPHTRRRLQIGTIYAQNRQTLNQGVQGSSP